ncbi:ABC transporter permease [Sporosarcina cascadiensis]|uniref:ABC transporter permease n=1 Tax=Sporosarcina cascadiensis TaxID=2660747 RepID=UPI00129A295E|nr:ABC transporter permease [Sporosarcina cascadiensis]
MTLNQLIFRNFKKNFKHYYVYIFALVFSVGLYFSFVTLQFDPAMDETKGTLKGAAAMKAGSVLLIAIVAVFLLYANSLFIKRRGKEIGLFQLIGMTKGTVFRILSFENLLLYIVSLLMGVLLGFSMSRLLMMILFNVTGIEDVATLHFSFAALTQTLIVFAAIYVLILLMNFIYIKRQSILALFRSTSVAQERVQRMSWFQIVIGISGLLLIGLGYYLSSILFSKVLMMQQLFLLMIAILASVIIGTYLFYKGSVSFLFQLVRRRKGGYLNVRDVLSLTSIMFRMKSNSLLLTIITSLSALAIGLLSLSYISYYSAEKSVEQSIPADFSIAKDENIPEFTDELQKEGIAYEIDKIALQTLQADITGAVSFGSGADNPFAELAEETEMTVISDRDVPSIKVGENEVYFMNRMTLLDSFLKFQTNGEVIFSGKEGTYPLLLKSISEETVLPTRISSGFPIAVVSQNLYEEMSRDLDPSLEPEFTQYTGIHIKDRSQVKQADEIFRETELRVWAGNESKYEEFTKQKQNMGMILFIVGFLGLAFLVTSGCIIYFKQMDESEDEKPNYTILRKLGFTQNDLLQGVQLKQLFNFGIPLVVGLCHSYFAVKSGWFLFGTEMVTPMLIVMLIYTVLYSIFGVLSVLNYKRVIKDAL